MRRAESDPFSRLTATSGVTLRLALRVPGVLLFGALGVSLRALAALSAGVARTALCSQRAASRRDVYVTPHGRHSKRIP